MELVKLNLYQELLPHLSSDEFWSRHFERHLYVLQYEVQTNRKDLMTAKIKSQQPNSAPTAALGAVST